MQQQPVIYNNQPYVNYNQIQSNPMQQQMQYNQMQVNQMQPNMMHMNHQPGAMYYGNQMNNMGQMQIPCNICNRNLFRGYDEWCIV